MFVPVFVADTPSAEHDRVQDGPEAFSQRFAMGIDRRSVSRTPANEPRRTPADRAAALPRRGSLDPSHRSQVAGFTRAISQSFNVLEAIESLEPVGPVPRGMDAPLGNARRVPRHRLGRSDRRWHVCPGKKRGAAVGNTKKGKGTKLMLMIDGAGTPLSTDIASANTAEVNLIEPLVERRVLETKPKRLLYDRAADSDPLRSRLAAQQIELICQHRKSRKKPATQDGRAARRLARRYRVERSISWLFNNRRLVVRYEHYDHLFLGFATLACVTQLLYKF